MSQIGIIVLIPNDPAHLAQYVNVLDTGLKFDRGMDCVSIVKRYIIMLSKCLDILDYVRIMFGYPRKWFGYPSI